MSISALGMEGVAQTHTEMVFNVATLAKRRETGYISKMFRETSPFALLALIISGRAILRARLLLRPAR